MGHLKGGKANVQILNLDDGVCQFTVYQLKKNRKRKRETENMSSRAFSSIWYVPIKQ